MRRLRGALQSTVQQHSITMLQLGLLQNLLQIVSRCACCRGSAVPEARGVPSAELHIIYSTAARAGRAAEAACLPRHQQLTCGAHSQAITGGKRVRAETSIASGAVSVSSAAAELALLKLPGGSFEDVSVCIVGAGKMSRLLLKHLASKGCRWAKNGTSHWFQPENGTLPVWKPHLGATHGAGRP